MHLIKHLAKNNEHVQIHVSAVLNVLEALRAMIVCTTDNGAPLPADILPWLNCL